MSDYGNSLNNLHQLLSEYISNIRNYLMNAASHNRYYKNVVHGHKNNNSEKNLAIIKPLKPPKLCVECFHTLFNQNNPHIPEGKLRVREVKNDSHVPLVCGRVRITLEQLDVRVLPPEKLRECFGFRELTTDESGTKQQGSVQRSDLLDLRGGP